MHKLLLTIGLLLLSLGIMTNYLLPIREPSWISSTLDAQRAERFVSISSYSDSPLITYFDSPNEGGVLYLKSKTGGNRLLENIKYYFTHKRDWMDGSVDDTKYTGRFISSVSDGQNVYVAYQEAEVGKEKVMFAKYDGSKWEKEVVDDVSNGTNVGLFISISILNNQPIIFYHTEQGQKFGFARRSLGEGGIRSNVNEVSPRWEKKTLETGVGWLTTTASCGDRVYAAYRSRDTDDIYLGELTAPSLNWSSKKLDLHTSTGLAVVALAKTAGNTACSPYLAYSDEKTGKIRLLDLTSNQTTDVADSPDSRISLSADNNNLYIFYRGTEGLVLARSTDGIDWNKQVVDTNPKAGNYHGLTIDKDGNIFIAYTDDKVIKFQEYNVSSVQTMQKAKKWAMIILSILGLASLGLALTSTAPFKGLAFKGKPKKPALQTKKKSG